jgi:hypothetical protein
VQLSIAPQAKDGRVTRCGSTRTIVLETERRPPASAARAGGPVTEHRGPREGVMRSRKQTPLPLEAPLRVRLTDDARARKAHELAVIGLSIRGHKRKLSNDARETKQEIARLEKDRAELEDQLIADEEMRPQGELFVGNTPSKEEAAAALGKVAVRRRRGQAERPSRLRGRGRRRPSRADVQALRLRPGRSRPRAGGTRLRGRWRRRGGLLALRRAEGEPRARGAGRGGGLDGGAGPGGR